MTRRLRRSAVATGFAALCLIVGPGAAKGSESRSARLVGADAVRFARGPIERKELPRGGTTITPRFLPVALYGAPQAAALGELGNGPPSQATRFIRRQSSDYRDRTKKRIYPAFELIATIAQASAGADGRYRLRQPDEVIRTYLDEAQRRDFLFLLDIQPGRSTFIDEVKQLRPWLRNRNVSIALDPEWNMGPTGVPGQTIGSVDAAMVNRVAVYMSRIVERYNLPNKLLLIHRFTDQMIDGEERIERQKGIELVLNVDGFGSPEAKRNAYADLVPPRQYLHPGFKLFYEEDSRNGSRLMTPDEVTALVPRPQYVVYE